MSDVDAERFWAIVDAARNEVDGWSADLDRRWAGALRACLITLPPDDILDFDRQLAVLRRLAETPEMAAATQLVVRPFRRNRLIMYCCRKPEPDVWPNGPPFTGCSTVERTVRTVVGYGAEFGSVAGQNTGRTRRQWPAGVGDRSARPHHDPRVRRGGQPDVRSGPDRGENDPHV